MYNIQINTDSPVFTPALKRKYYLDLLLSTLFLTQLISLIIKVFSFNASAINGADDIQQLAKSIAVHSGEQFILSLSASNLDTSSLEKITLSFYNSDTKLALDQFDTIKNRYIKLAGELLSQSRQQALDELNNFFTEVEWMLHDKPVRALPYYNAQIVCAGELLLSVVVSSFLNESGIKNRWIDARDVVRTDSNFSNAAVDIDFTSRLVSQVVLPLFCEDDIIITQANIGATDENENTRLNQGSDNYSAGLFASILNIPMVGL